MALKGRQDAQTMTAGLELANIPINGVHVVRTRNVVTRNGYMTELFRSDWPQTGYDARHVIINRWDSPLATDWFSHQKQTDHVSVILGRVMVALYDNRPDSPTAEKTMTVRCDWADPQTVIVPPNVFHAFKVLIAPMIMLTTITHTYDYDDPDHWRLTGDSRKKIPLDLASLT